MERTIGKTLDILMLEDIPIDAELTEQELHSADIPCTLKRVATRAKFLKALEDRIPDIILADYTLPQFSGLDALRLVKEMKLEVPFILVTGTQKEEVAVECMKEGADDYILKTSLKRLPAAILNVLQKKEAERESRHLAEQLQDSVKQVLTTFESITDAFFAVDDEWRLMYLNPRSDNFLSKVQKRREDLWGSYWWDEFPMSEDSEGARSLRRAVADRVPVEFEQYFPLLKSWLHMRAYPAENGLSIYAEDISARKLVERVQCAVYKISEAASTQQNLEHLFGKIHEIIAELMPVPNMYFVLYDSVRKLISFPYYVDDHNEQPEPRELSAGLAEYVLRTGQPLLASKENIDELVRAGEVTQSGVECIDWLGVPLKTGSTVIGVLAVQSYTEGVRFGDAEKNMLLYVSEQVAMVIERKRAEEQIRQQAHLLEIAQDAIMVLDMSNNIVYWNKGAERVYGWTKEESIGANANRLYQGEGNAVDEMFHHVREKGTWFGELNQVTKDGKEVIVESRWSLVCDDLGKPTSILVIATDVSEQKKLEQQFLRAQRLESIGTLASGLAHDLNNVLAPIIMAIPLLKDKVHETQELEILETLENAARRGEGIVKQVLSFVRGVQGERVILQPKHLITELKSFLSETLPPSIRVQARYAKDLLPIQGDATQVYQILVNLAVNARDAMPEGGTLSVEVQNVELDEQTASAHLDAHPGRYIVVTMADTGSGMSPEVMNRIFDPFFTTKDPGKGTGLGLFTVMTIVKNHGGFMDVQSEVGKGTQFRVYFPATDAPVIRQGVTGLQIPKGNGQCVLVVDDEESLNDLIQATLKSRDYRVLSAKDGTEALTLYMQHKDEIEVVLMDLLMPFLDGPTTVRTMQRINPDVRIVAMSGLLVDKEKRDELLSSAAIPFIQKPFSVEQLLTVIHETINKTALAQAV